MKRKPSEYSLQDTGFFEFDDTDIENYYEKLVKCRKPHECSGGCDKTIQIGEYAVRESGFLDGEPVSNYVCTDCIDAWLDELEEGAEHEATV